MDFILKGPLVSFCFVQDVRAGGGRGSAVDARSKSCFIAIGHLFSRPSTQSLRLFIYQAGRPLLQTQT